LGLRFIALQLKALINGFFENTVLLNFLPYFFIDRTIDDLRQRKNFKKIVLNRIPQRENAI